MKLGYAVVAPVRADRVHSASVPVLPLAQASPDMLHHAAARPLALWTLSRRVGGDGRQGAVPAAPAHALARAAPLDRAHLRVAVMLGAVSGFVLGATALGGPVTQTGFATLAFLSGGITFIALRHASRAGSTCTGAG